MFRPRFHTPTTLEEAEALLKATPSTALVAGGQWIVPRLSRGDDQADHLISTHRIGALKGIQVSGETLTLGAAETHSAIAKSETVRERCPVLAEIAGQIGDPATRNCGTLGGGLCADALHSDYSLALLGLDAVLTTTRRQISANAFLASNNPALSSDEILVSVSFQTSLNATFLKRANRASNAADPALFVAPLSDDDHRLVIAGSGHPPSRLTEAEASLNTGRELSSLLPEGSSPSKDAFFASQINALWTQVQ